MFFIAATARERSRINPPGTSSPSQVDFPKNIGAIRGFAASRFVRTAPADKVTLSMVRAGEIEHGALIADRAEAVWNWTSPAGRQRAERRARLIIREAGLQPGMHVLELGCGTGVFSRYFASTGCRLTAIDVSPELLHQAAENVTGDHVEFRVDDAERLSADAHTFDAVVGSSVLHHLQLSPALKEILRVLKPSGRIAFAEPNMMNPQIAAQRNVPFLRRWAGESPEETAFFRWGIESTLRDAGFTTIRVQPHDFLHPSTPRPLLSTIRFMGSVLERIPVVREIAGSLLISACAPIVP